MRRVKVFFYALKFYLYNGGVSHLPSYKLRRWYLNSILKFKIDKSSAIHMGCFFTGANFTMGANSVINRNCYLDCREGIEIGNNVSISPEFYILTAGHDVQSPSFAGKNKTTVIEDFVWLGARAIIMPGCTMGKGSVAAAGSVVTKPIKPFEIVGGNPAVFMKARNKELSYKIDWFPFFNTDIM